jgi:hypothetical protein
MRLFAFTAWAAISITPIACAQDLLHKEPMRYAATERASRVEVRPPGIRLGLRKAREFALAPLSASETARLAEPGTRLKVAVHRDLPPSAFSTGAWETTSEGARVWRLALRSPGSEGIRVQFTNFSAGNGKVWLHNGDESVGPYTGRGIFDNGEFWSGTVFSESVTLEYEPDPAASADSAVPFEIASISHRAHPAPKQARTLPSARDAAAPDAAAPDAAKDPAAYCHLDPNCYPDWKPAMKMVASLIMEEDGAGYYCSGSLIGTRDNSFKPYLLTAGHCIHSEDAARSLEVYWTYQTSSCSAPPPADRSTSTKSSVGAHLLSSATIGQGDYSLVLLKDIPNDVTFAGWDISDPPIGSPLTGVHHPMGSWKRISFGERAEDINVSVDGDTASGSTYMTIVWDKGRAEPGSSGSPLFSSPGVVVGTLTYGLEVDGLSVCQLSPSITGYARFSNTYQALRDYLENLPSAEALPDRTGLAFTVTNHAAPAAQTFRITTQTAGQVTFKLRADAPWIQLSTDTGTISAGKPATIGITLDPARVGTASRYTGTVSILSGAAPPQFVNITATTKVDASNVTASISPNPVLSTAAQWSFQISLKETAGAATRLTQIKLNGADYTSSIKDWFGSGSIAANGSIVAPLTGTGMFPRGDQYFEFWGIDDLSGQHWYRVATVTFQ